MKKKTNLSNQKINNRITKAKSEKAKSEKNIKNKEMKKKNKISKKSEKKFEVKKEMTFAQLLEKKPQAINILFENGLHCIGCHMSAYETIEQGCLAHGMCDKDIDTLIKQLNKF